MNSSVRLLLALLLSAAVSQAFGLQSAAHFHGRRMLDDNAAVSSGNGAIDTFRLPIGSLKPRPSPLLGLSPVHGWQTVPSDNSSADGELDNRIINGQADTGNQMFPYAAYLEISTADGYAACTGSLIAPNYVLTAAHCVSTGGSVSPASSVSLRIAGLWHTATAVYVRPEFSDNNGPTSSPSFDFAVVQLGETSSAPTVALPSPGSQEPTVGETVWAAGYGIVDESTGDTSPDQLRYTSLTVFADSDCPAAFPDDFCAGGTAGYTCNGDSGGPIVLPTQSGDVLVGLTSFGPADCTQPYAFYLRTAYHLDQINSWLAGGGSSASGGSGGFVSSPAPVSSGGGDTGGGSGGIVGAVTGTICSWTGWLC